MLEQKSEIKLGKVDATIETDLAEKHKIKGYPTLKFYHKGTFIDYSGGRKSEDIVSWLIKKTGPPAKDLPTVDEAKAFLESNDVVIVGFFKVCEFLYIFLLKISRKIFLWIFIVFFINN